jgi:hypothetical protein
MSFYSWEADGRWEKTLSQISSNSKENCPQKEEDLEKIILNAIIKDTKNEKRLAPFLNTDTSKLIERLLKNLSERERYIITEYFGLGTEKKTMTKIASHLEISKARVPELIKRISRELKEEIRKLAFNIHGELLPNMDLASFKVIKSEYHSPILAARVEALKIKGRAENCFRHNKIKYVYQLVQASQKDLLKTTNFGLNSLKKIEEELHNLGLSLNTVLDEKTIQEVEYFLA